MLEPDLSPEGIIAAMENDALGPLQAALNECVRICPCEACKVNRAIATTPLLCGRMMGFMADGTAETVAANVYDQLAASIEAGAPGAPA